MGWGFTMSKKKSSIPSSTPSPNVSVKPTETTSVANSTAKASPTKGGFSEKRLIEWFEKYKDPSANSILADGMERFCEDISIDPSDIKILILCWKLNAQVMCEFSYDEFVGGFKPLSVDSVESLHTRLSQWQTEVQNESSFKELYKYAFKYGREKGQRSIDIAVAQAYVQLLLAPRYQHAVRFVEFLNEKPPKGMSEDQWNLLYTFCATIKPDFSNFDLDSSAWPIVVDEFVQWCQEKNTAA